MKLLIIGHKGYLGSYLNYKLRDYTDSVGPYDYIINCAGLVSVELSEKNPMKSYNSNYKIVRDLIKEYPDSKIIHFSSYYVYNERKVICDELSNTTDQYNYMKHKLMSEKIVLISGGVCFRLGKLYGHPNINNYNKLTEYIIKSKDNLILDNISFNPTSVDTVLDVIKYELKNKDLYGLYNLADDGITTHYKYGKYILEKLGIERGIKHINKCNKFDSYGNFVMSIDKIKKKIYIDPWSDRMNAYLDNIIERIKNV